MKIITFLFFIFLSISSFSQEKELDFYIQKAAINSPLLKDLSNQILSNKMDSLLTVATYKPNVTGTLNTYIAPYYNGYGYDEAISNGQSVTGIVGFTKKLISKKISASQAESFQLIKESLVLNKKIAFKDLKKTIISQYISTSGTAQQIDYNQKTMQLLQNEAVILKKLTQSSIYKQTDYLIFLSTLKQQELQVLQLKQLYQNNLGILNYLAGETDTTQVQLKKPTIDLVAINQSSSLPFLKKFEIDSLKISNQNKVVDNAYKPSYSLMGDAGYNSTFYSQGYKNFGFSVGLNISLPIYDGGQRNFQHQKNEAALETIKGYKSNFNKQYQQQLMVLHQKLNQNKAIAKQLDLQLQIAETLIEADKKLLLSGDAQITDFVIAIGNVITINNTISQNKIDQLQLINEINYWHTNN